MGITQNKLFNPRKFISMSLFLNFTVMVMAAFIIQVFEATKNDFFMHFFTVTHIFTGIAFTVLSILHIIMNIQSMKGYIKNKGQIISREAIYAFLLTIIMIFIAVLFVCLLMD